MLLGEPDLEGHVGVEVLVARLELKALTCALAIELNRYQNERCVAFDLGPSVFKPLEKSEREIEDVDALLLLALDAFVVEGSQALLEALGAQVRLEDSVAVPGRHTVFGFRSRGLRRSPDGVVGVGVFLFRLDAPSWGEGHFFLLREQHLEDLIGELIDDPNLLRALGRQGTVDELVAEVALDQLMAGRFKLAPHDVRDCSRRFRRIHL